MLRLAAKLRRAPCTTALPGVLSPRRWHGHELKGDRSKPLPITFQHPDGRRQEATAYVGQTLLEAAHEAGIPIEAACAGSCACSTCHMYIDPAKFELLPEPSDRELDMLDLAFFPEANSRLSCQVPITRELSGMVVTLPKATRNMAVDGYVAQPH